MLSRKGAKPDGR